LPHGDAWTYSASGLPAGLTINKNNGAISGNLTGAAKAYSVTVTASDGQGGSASATFTWNVTTLSVTNPGKQNNAVGDKVSLALQSSGLPAGATPTYSAMGLPAGLSINASTGVISGTVSKKAGSYTVTVTLSDGMGASVSQTFTWTISVLAMNNPGTQTATIGTGFSLSLVASGLPAGDTWSFLASSLPPGLTINKTTGVISGTVQGPLTSYAVTVTASDGDGASTSVTFTINVV
jgi:hypothetical protein